jgi:hypothetical protein
MPVRLGTPPQEAIDSIVREVDRARGTSGFETFSVGVPVLRDVGAVETFVLRRDQIEQNQGLRAAQKTGWRMRTTAGVVAEVLSLDQLNHRLSHVESSHLAQSFDLIIEQSVPIARLPDADYELRALFAPEFALLCAWLHTERLDFLVPLPGSSYLTVWTAYTEDEVMNVLRALAASRPIRGLV